LRRLTRLDELTLKATEHTRWLAGTRREAYINLSDLVTGDGACVLDAECHLEHIRPETGAATGLDLALRYVIRALEYREGERLIRKRSVAQAITELEPGRNVVRVKVAIVDVKLFGVVDLRDECRRTIAGIVLPKNISVLRKKRQRDAGATYENISRIVAPLLGDRVWETGGRVHGTD
jgi:hypothetical protein